jgi:flagellar biosynthetic protein FliR
MGGSLVLSISTLLGFLLTLVRIAGVFAFVPLPGVTAVTHPAKIMLTIGVSIALFPVWPQVSASPSVGLFAMWILLEAGLGVGIGLSVAFVADGLALGAQVMGLQAGYSFASTVDPNTQADSTVLAVFAQLASGMLFFATGLDRDVLQIFAHSLQTCPPGAFLLGRGAAEQMVAMGSTMFSTGLRLALPMIAVLSMVDISLALLGRVNAQLQLLHLAFPVKMMVGLVLLGWVALMIPALFRGTAATTLAAAWRLIAR